MVDHSKLGNSMIPQNKTINLFNVVYDDEFVFLINSLSSLIKNYFKLTRSSIAEINEGLGNINLYSDLNKNEAQISFQEFKDIISKAENCENKSKDIEKELNVFFDKAKDIFKKMKQTRNSKIETATDLYRGVINNKENINDNSEIRKFKTERTQKSNSPTIRFAKSSRNFNPRSSESANKELAQKMLIFIETLELTKGNIGDDKLELLKNEMKNECLKLTNKPRTPSLGHKKENLSFTFNGKFEETKSKNDNLINQLKNEIKNLIKDKNSLQQENKKLKEEYDSMALLKDLSKVKAKSIQVEKIKSYEEQVAFLAKELDHKTKLLENNKNLEFEIAKLKNEISLINDENYEKSLKKEKEKNKELLKEIDAKEEEIDELNKKIKENREDIANKENVILMLTGKNTDQVEKIKKLSNQVDELTKNINDINMTKLKKEEELSNLSKIIKKQSNDMGMINELQSTIAQMTKEKDENKLQYENAIKELNDKDKT